MYNFFFDFFGIFLLFKLVVDVIMMSALHHLPRQEHGLILLEALPRLVVPKLA